MTTFSEKLTDQPSELERIVTEMSDRTVELERECRSLKSQLFEAQQALLKEGMRGDALQARIDGGIRVQADWFSDIGYVLTEDSGQYNATLIFDEGAQL